MAAAVEAVDIETEANFSFDWPQLFLRGLASAAATSQASALKAVSRSFFGSAS